MIWRLLSYRACKSINGSDITRSQHKTHLSQRNRAMLRVIEYIAKSLMITQGHSPRRTDFRYFLSDSTTICENIVQLSMLDWQACLESGLIWTRKVVLIWEFWSLFILKSTLKKSAYQSLYWGWSHVMWKSFENVAVDRRRRSDAGEDTLRKKETDILQHHGNCYRQGSVDWGCM